MNIANFQHVQFRYSKLCFIKDQSAAVKALVLERLDQVFICLKRTSDGTWSTWSHVQVLTHLTLSLKILKVSLLL